MPFRFSILRLLLVVAVFAAVFALTEPLGLRGIPSALLVAIPLSGIVFLAKSRDVVSVIRSLVSCGLGAFVGLLFCAMVRPPYEPGNEFLYMMAGAVIGWILGLALCPHNLSNQMPYIGQPGSREVHGERRKRLWIWKVIAPLVAFLAGPAIATLFWMLEVYVFDRAFFTAYDRIETLMDAIQIGVFVGFVASVVVVLRILPSN